MVEQQDSYEKIEQRLKAQQDQLTQLMSTVAAILIAVQGLQKALGNVLEGAGVKVVQEEPEKNRYGR